MELADFLKRADAAPHHPAGFRPTARFEGITIYRVEPGAVEDLTVWCADEDPEGNDLGAPPRLVAVWESTVDPDWPEGFVLYRAPWGKTWGGGMARIELLENDVRVGGFMHSRVTREDARDASAYTSRATFTPPVYGTVLEAVGRMVEIIRSTDASRRLGSKEMSLW